MSEGLGQSRKDWKNQLQKLPNIKKLDPEPKEIVVDILLKGFNIYTTKDETYIKTSKRIKTNFSRIGYFDDKNICYNSFKEYYQHSGIENPYLDEEKYKANIISLTEETNKNIIEIMKKLSDSNYLQRLKSKNKNGIIDANFIINFENKKNKNEKYQVDFAKILSVSEWENMYKQSTKIAQMRGLDIVPILNIDKYFCQIFDTEKVKKVMPELDGFGFKDVWDETIEFSISIMKNLLKSNKRKKQLDYLTLTIFYHVINRLSNELVSTNLYSAIKNYNDINLLKNDDEKLKKFVKDFNKKNRNFFIVSKKEFMNVYKIPEKTFYRRQNVDYLPFKKSLLLGFFNRVKAVSTKHTYGIFEDQL